MFTRKSGFTAMPLNLQQFAGEGDGDPGVETVPAAGEQPAQPQTDNPGVDTPTAAESKEPNNFEKAFAKRLAAKEAEWAEKYKDYDVYKEIADYTRETSGYQDILSVKEAIELERLHARAEKENVPPEILKRIDELEAKAARGEELEKKQQEQEVYQQFRTNLETFAKEHNVDPDALHNFMYENEISKLDVALKAMKHDELLQQIESAKKEGVKEFLAAKDSIPKVEGGGNASGQVIPGTPKTFNDARARAMARLESNGKMEG